MQARDIMTLKPLTATITTSLAEVMDTMLDKGIRHMPIVNGDELVGMISDRDLRQLSRDLLSDRSARAQLQAPATKLMSADLLTADAEDDIDEVINLMVEHRVGAVPIINGDGNLVGIVSYIDVLRAAVGKL